VPRARRRRRGAAAPLFALIALAIALDSPGRAIFRQRRVGRGGRPFTVNKFRTMRSEAGHQEHKEYVLQLIATDAPNEDSHEPLLKLSADRRVTRVGRLLRRSSLDELP
jgi:lipopolysaccharide/colanic/teichoic acid biosynthesis glycosyltransferase